MRDTDTNTNDGTGLSDAGSTGETLTGSERTSGASTSDAGGSSGTPGTSSDPNDKPAAGSGAGLSTPTPPPPPASSATSGAKPSAPKSTAATAPNTHGNK